MGPEVAGPAFAAALDGATGAALFAGGATGATPAAEEAGPAFPPATVFGVIDWLVEGTIDRVAMGEVGMTGFTDCVGTLELLVLGLVVLEPLMLPQVPLLSVQVYRSAGLALVTLRLLT